MLAPNAVVKDGTAGLRAPITDVPLSKTAKRVFMKMARKIGHSEVMACVSALVGANLKAGRLLLKELKFHLTISLCAKFSSPSFRNF